MYRYTPSRAGAAYAAFAAFGAFWGAWGAALPAVRDQAGVSEAELGTALLCVGAGALPAMPLAGRAVDRWGARVPALLLLALGAAGVAVVLAAHDFARLAAGLAVVGAASGGADVAINATAAAAERETGRPVITRAHGCFSAGVVVVSLATGLLLGVGAPLVVPVLLAAATAVPAAVALAGRRGAVAAARALRGEGGGAPGGRGGDAGGRGGDAGGGGARRGLRALPLAALLVAGALAALAYAVENAHQSWSAVFLSDTLAAGPAVAAAGPAMFAGVTAVVRFAVSAIRAAPALVVAGGAALAAAGSALMAVAPSVPVALAGLALAAAGTAVVVPTLLATAVAGVDDEARGAATSVVATTGYLGFLAGPAYVGAAAAATDLPGAMLAVAALAAALALLAVPALTRSPTGRARRGGRGR